MIHRKTLHVKREVPPKFLESTGGIGGAPFVHSTDAPPGPPKMLDRFQRRVKWLESNHLIHLLVTIDRGKWIERGYSGIKLGSRM